MQPRCWIVGAGECCWQGWAPREGDLIIAADAGQRALARLGVEPDVLIGDFDSLAASADAPDALGSVDAAGEVVRLPVEKDDTDTAAAIRLGLARGLREFRLYGGAGGRIDHTIANIQLLAYLSRRGARGVMCEQSRMLCAITGGEMRFLPQSRGMLSAFALGGIARGVTLEGLKYPLRDGALEADFPLGVSNEFLGCPARVTVREGTLLLAWAHTAVPAGL